MQEISTQESSKREGSLTKAIEEQTSKVPSLFFLALAAGATAISLALATSKEKRGLANFVGLWVPSLLLVGLYNKLVKIESSDLQQKASLH